MLTKKLDGLWTDRLGFVAAIMLNWNSEDKNGIKHYVFLSSPFNAMPHDIVSNGEDDSVLLSQDMYNTLLARKAVRPITDDEAAAANKNSDVIQSNELNANKLAEVDKVVTAANVEAAKTSANPSAKASEVPKVIKVAPQVEATAEEKAVIATVGKVAIGKEK